MMNLLSRVFDIYVVLIKFRCLGLHIIFTSIFLLVRTNRFFPEPVIECKDTHTVQDSIMKTSVKTVYSYVL